MSGTRVPFDSSSSFIVATQDLLCGPTRFVRGDAFPWRELGISEFELAQLWVSNKVDAVVPDAGPTIEECKQKFDSPTSPVTLPAQNRFLATPSERVVVETPAQERRRRDRR